jgi:uncharacterized membrane protein YozB (DUF420 family)
MSVLIAMFVTAGFASSYLPKVVSGSASIPSVIHLHAAVFATWLGLLVVQTTLIRRKRIDLHQRIGTMGIGLIVLMLCVGVWATLTVTRLGHKGIPGAMFPDAGGFLLLNLLSLAVFASLAAAGWLLRRRPAAHKRLMLMATVGGLGPPGIARLPLIAGHLPAVALLSLAFLLAGPVYDIASRKRLHPAYIIGVLVSLLAVPPVVEGFAATAAWRNVAAWLLGP